MRDSASGLLMFLISVTREGWHGRSFAMRWNYGRASRIASFIKTLKQEQLEARQYRTLEELREHLEKFMAF
jgi:hypothetical protein